MKRIFLIGLVSLFLMGCTTIPIGSTIKPATETKFFGIKVNNLSDVKNFTIKNYDEKEGVKYEYGRGTDKNIYAWGSVLDGSGPNYYYNQITIKVINNSNGPISTNYFMDDFKAITNDGKTYDLEKSDILDYPKVQSINPNCSVTFKVKKPYNISGKDIEIIICRLSLGTIIVLKPVPKATSHNQCK